MAANVAVAQDPAGSLKPAKDKSTERIDRIVALIMALLPGEAPLTSVYEHRGLIILGLGDPAS
jgi:phage terminase large subunit-like protein